jgi:MFS family permease
MYVSDEYRASQQNAPAWFYILIWIGWIALTIAAYVIGKWLSDSVTVSLLGSNATGRALSIDGNVQIAGLAGYGVAIVGGIVSGLVLGVAQGIVLLPLLKRAGAGEWVLATVIGRTIQWFIVYIVGMAMLGITFDKEIPTVLLLLAMLALTGVLSGVALGYPQAQVFKRRANRSGVWLVANIIGPVVTGLVVGMTLFVQGQNTLRDYTTLLTAIIAALSTGFALLEILHHPLPAAEWQDTLIWDRPEPDDTTDDTVLGSSLYNRKR